MFHLTSMTSRLDRVEKSKPLDDDGSLDPSHCTVHLARKLLKQSSVAGARFEHYWRKTIRGFQVCGVQYNCSRETQLDFLSHGGVQIHIQIVGGHRYQVEQNAIVQSEGEEFQLYTCNRPWTKRIFEPADSKTKSIVISMTLQQQRYFLGEKRFQQLRPRGHELLHSARPIKLGILNVAKDALAYSEGEGISEVFREARLLELAALCLQEMSFATEGPKRARLRSNDYERIALARKLIVEHLSTPLTIPALATEVGINPSKLKMTFKAVTGSTIADYRRIQRLRKAAILLKGGVDVSTASYSLGFEHAGHFARLFREQFGIYPSEYRNVYSKFISAPAPDVLLQAD
jgi:AraC-like DNA-binding protein